MQRGPEARETLGHNILDRHVLSLSCVYLPLPCSSEMGTWDPIAGKMGPSPELYRVTVLQSHRICPRSLTEGCKIRRNSDWVLLRVTALVWHERAVVWLGLLLVESNTGTLFNRNIWTRCFYIRWNTQYFISLSLHVLLLLPPILVNLPSEQIIF